MSPACDPLELYASAMDTSDYARTLAPVVRTLVPDIGALLDVGAGGGQLGQAIRDPRAAWTAIEPSPTMRRRLERLSPAPGIIAAGWQEAAVADKARGLKEGAAMAGEALDSGRARAVLERLVEVSNRG